MMKLTQHIQAGFPDTKEKLPSELHEFWLIRHSLFNMDKVIMHCEHERDLHHESLPPNSNIHKNVSRIIIAPPLRTEVI